MIDLSISVRLPSSESGTASRLNRARSPASPRVPPPRPALHSAALPSFTEQFAENAAAQPGWLAPPEPIRQAPFATAEESPALEPRQPFGAAPAVTWTMRQGNKLSNRVAAMEYQHGAAAPHVRQIAREVTLEPGNAGFPQGLALDGQDLKTELLARAADSPVEAQKDEALKRGSCDQGTGKVDRIQGANRFGREGAPGAIDYVAVNAQEDPMSRRGVQPSPDVGGAGFRQPVRGLRSDHHAVAFDEGEIGRDNQISSGQGLPDSHPRRLAEQPRENGTGLGIQPHPPPRSSSRRRWAVPEGRTEGMGG